LVKLIKPYSESKQALKLAKEGSEKKTWAARTEEEFPEGGEISGKESKAHEPRRALPS
jgi:hypothetical protein